jgi:outer membrane protein assembly factor BamD
MVLCIAFVPLDSVMSYRPKLAVLFCLCLLAVAGCSHKGDEEASESPAAVAEKQVPVETLYNRAAQQLDAGEYAKAAKAFDEVDRQYPYSQWATRAQLMAGYAWYKTLKYDQAVVALERFIELHPGDPNVGYAWYLKSLCFYEQISDVRRDQKMTELALDSLHQVVSRFPDSKYARDAALKIDLATDHLAGKEMEIGRYYLLRRQYPAAIPRFRRVVDQYQTTTHVPEALHRLVEAYLSLGMKEEALKAAAVLGHNFPQSSWYRDTYRLMKGKNETEKSFLDRVTGGIL